MDRFPDERNARKHGGAKRPSPRFLEPVAKPWLDWRKTHIGIDEKSLEIRAAEFTTSDVGDAPMLPELRDQIPPEQQIASGELANADGAFDTRKCHDAIAARGAAAFGYPLGPVAFVPSLPPRKNAKPWKPDTGGALGIVLGPMADNASPRNEILRTSKRVGRTIWRRW